MSWTPVINIIIFNCQFDTNLESSRKKEVHMKNCPDKTGLSPNQWGIFNLLVDNLDGPSLLGAVPFLEV